MTKPLKFTISEKLTSKDFPNKVLLKGRSSHYQLSTTNASGYWPRFFGIAGVVLTSLGLVVSLINPVFVFAPLLIFCFLLFSVGFTYSVGRELSVEHSKVYSPGYHALFRSLTLSLGFLFMTILLVSLFLLGSNSQGKNFITFILVFGVFFLTTLVGSIMEGIKIFNLIWQELVYGSTSVEVHPYPPRLGNVLTVRINNNNLFKNFNSMEVVLRNIHECWEKRGKKKDTRHTNYQLYQERKTIAINANPTELEFKIPDKGVAPTDYKSTAPFYWEVEISNAEAGFFCRYLIEVAD